MIELKYTAIITLEDAKIIRKALSELYIESHRQNKTHPDLDNIAKLQKEITDFIFGEEDQ